MADTTVHQNCTEVVWPVTPLLPKLGFETDTKRARSGPQMDHLRFGIGTLWLVLTIGAAAFLSTDFILQEIRIIIRQRREAGTK
jgi:hypothetical protein